ncbi:MAG TPA: PepSY domain-containing protein, partial [Gemmatales bacterium]|nr:PepSY domain-containing protein [Gemmatales bacterium]
MPINWRLKMRQWHRLGAILVALPFLLVIITGILLLIKKDWSWVQPPTQKGMGKIPMISMDAILEAARKTPECEVNSWKDIPRIDIQPSKGIAKVQAANNWEIQVDLQTGNVLQVAYRRSDI